MPLIRMESLSKNWSIWKKAAPDIKRDFTVSVTPMLHSPATPSLPAMRKAVPILTILPRNQAADIPKGRVTVESTTESSITRVWQSRRIQTRNMSWSMWRRLIKNRMIRECLLSIRRAKSKKEAYVWRTDGNIRQRSPEDAGIKSPGLMMRK